MAEVTQVRIKHSKLRITPEGRHALLSNAEQLHISGDDVEGTVVVSVVVADEEFVLFEGYASEDCRLSVWPGDSECG